MRQVPQQPESERQVNIEQRPIDEVHPYPDNPRDITPDAVQAVADSISAYGWQQPIVVDREGVVIAGHTRLAAASKLGLDLVPVTVADLDENEARAYRLADNRVGEYAAWDIDKLLGELDSDDLPAGFSDLDFEAAEAAATPPPGPKGASFSNPDYTPVQRTEAAQLRILHYFGSKHRLAPYIASLMPKHRQYVEPFCGSAIVLMAKPSRAKTEIINDLDGDLVNIYRCLQDEKLSEKLRQAVWATPWSRAESERLATEPAPSDPVERARRTLYVSWSKYHNPGEFRADFSMSNLSAWNRWPDYVPIWCDRLRGVVIENRDALQMLERKGYDRRDTLWYLDPPYVPDTRVGDADDYVHEMTVEDHEAMLQAVVKLKGPVMISGFDSDLYNDALVGWKAHRLNASTSSKSVKANEVNARTEVVWVSPMANR